ncbi:unnamed protein product [Bursaphelenchus xylophilus]|uniref:Inhibitor of growth protein n=1 Tax=Bursaphelenchus xylophilus TaxID=6326 RepID=A0A1I7RP97_BURXY|nr:unnamed protein product [Bursaphelenchus xylophilus]CAG9100024.1 unnamed protein product [Bursaphelenchus xylophilus]
MDVKIQKPLSRFMKKLDRLAPQLTENFAEIQVLDRKAREDEDKLKRICGTVGSSQSRSPKQKRDQHEERHRQLMKILDEMEESCKRKLELASTSYETVDKYINDLDKSYFKFTQNLSAPMDNKRSNQKASGSGRKKKRKASEMAETDGTATESLEFDSPLVEMPVDPNEPTYCYCHQVSFGQMIMCDNKTCTIEWFHFQCVGLTSTPRGKWYCDNCKAKIKRGRKPSAPM